jgi:phosphohistidine phosphatase
MHDADMGTLYLLRHAKSSWDDPDLDDHDRPLNGRGRRSVEQLQATVGEKQLQPQLVICSTATRARQTLEPLLPDLRGTQVRYDDAMYGASAGQLLDLLRAVSPDVGSVLLVGHNPGMEDLAHRLSGQPTPLSTAALATLQVNAPWPELSTATLVDVFLHPGRD